MHIPMTSHEKQWKPWETQSAGNNLTFIEIQKMSVGKIKIRKLLAGKRINKNCSGWSTYNKNDSLAGDTTATHFWFGITKVFNHLSVPNQYSAEVGAISTRWHSIIIWRASLPIPHYQNSPCLPISSISLRAGKQGGAVCTRCLAISWLFR